MLTTSKAMSDGNLEEMIIAKHRIDFMPEKTQLIHSAYYQKGPNAQEFEKAEIHKILSQKAIESARTGLATSIVFSSKKDGSLRFRWTP